MNTEQVGVTPKIVKDITVKFAGDSGDGIQLTGSQLAKLSNEMGNAVVTFSSFPAEIRPPAGTLAGVSGYQLHVSGEKVYTPGDDLDVLVAFNPAALKANIKEVRKGGVVIVNEDSFTKQNLEKAEYTDDPFVGLEAYQIIKLPVTTLNKKALTDSPLTPKEKDRCKNFFLLGLISWLFGRRIESMEVWIDDKFSNRLDVAEANKIALNSGYNYGDNTEKFITPFKIENASFAKQENIRFISGNSAIVEGLVKAARAMKKRLVLGGYPITPASDILHETAKYSDGDIVAFQAEDELAAVGAAIGASYAGEIGVTCTAGPGIALMQEFINLAMIAELPLVVFDIQRSGPSTGMPTKMEQTDLFQALYGRNGESPVAVLAPRSPQDCFHIAQEAVRIATKFMVPVFVLSDLFLANSSEPLVDADRKVNFEPSPKGKSEGFQPYKRNPETLARPWAPPGELGFEHIVGGLEKQVDTGKISYDPDNHEQMCRLRAEKVERIARDIEPLEVIGEEEGDILLLGWGSTYGPVYEATKRLNQSGVKTGAVNLRHVFPLPLDLEPIMKRYKKVAVVENNLGQLIHLIRSKYLIDARGIQKVQGIPFYVRDIENMARKILQGEL